MWLKSTGSGRSIAGLTRQGANIPGKPRGTYIFPGGAPLYRAICDEMTALGFASFALDGAAPPVPPMVRLDPAIAMVIGAMTSQGIKPLEVCTVEETRAIVDSLTLMQAPPRDAHVVHTTYPSPSKQPLPARIYRPDAEGELPVVVFLYPWGWIAGGLDVVDERCRALAHELGAVVVSASYRLAPEHRSRRRPTTPTRRCAGSPRPSPITAATRTGSS